MSISRYPALIPQFHSSNYYAIENKAFSKKKYEVPVSEPNETSLLTAPQRDLPPPTRKGEDRATPFREPHRRAHQQKELACNRNGCERACEVVSLVALLPFVSAPRILRKYRSRNGIERRVLAVLGGMFRCKEIKEGLEGDGGVCQVLVGICV